MSSQTNLFNFFGKNAQPVKRKAQVRKDDETTKSKALKTDEEEGVEKIVEVVHSPKEDLENQKNDVNIESKSTDKTIKPKKIFGEQTKTKSSVEKEKKVEEDKKEKETSPVATEEPKKMDVDKKEVAATKKINKPTESSEGKAKGNTMQMTSNSQKSEVSLYNPCKEKYHVVDDACWAKGEPVPYSALSETFEHVEKESKRLKIQEIISNLMRSIIVLTPEDLLPCAYLCLNKLAPAFEGLELGVGESIILKAIRTSTGRGMDSINNDLETLGDVGLVAAASRSKQRTLFKPKPLTVRSVFATLKKLAAYTGNSCQQKKVDGIKSGLVACQTGADAKFFTRAVSGKLRIGLAEASVLAAIGQAVTYTPPQLGKEEEQILDSREQMIKSKKDPSTILERNVGLVKTAFCEMPSLDVLIPALLNHDVEELPKHCTITPGIPLKPMLAHPTKSVDVIFQRFEGLAFTCEYKYDGERAQIHLTEDGKIAIFSRNQEDNTQKFPDVIKRIPEVIKEGTTSFIIDCEAVAWDCKEKKILPFQVLSTRKRKDVDVKDISVQVCLFAFDLLYLNGKSYHRESFAERRKLLYDNFIVQENVLQFAKASDSNDTDDIATFLDESIKASCEGLMVKTLNESATYEIAKRSHNWLKLKSDYLEGLGDTLDLVVIGASVGQGKRTGVYGNFLLACYDQDSEKYQSICKLGTGLSDEALAEFSKTLKEHVIDKPKGYYQVSGSDPGVWFEPAMVWEIKASDLSISPRYHAASGLVHNEKGISLRFPRFIRVRDDKTPEEATSAEQVAEFYNRQDNKQEKTFDEQY